MKHHRYFRSFYILVIIGMILGLGPINGQDAKSNVVRFKISNLPDTEPPLIKIMTPSIAEGTVYRTSTAEIVLIGEVTDKSGVKFVSVNDDVRSINEAGIFTARLELANGINTIQLIAADQEDNLADQSISIEYNPPIVTLADRIKATSKYYGLMIGIDKYQDPNLPDLDNPVKDAEKLYNTLTSKYVFDQANMIILKNAKRTDIVDALDYLANTMTPDDNLLIFYAGHGNWDERANVGYWLPSDAYLSSSANWFPNSALVDYLKLINSKHTLLITDACFSGSIFKSRSGFPQLDRAYEVMYDLTSRKAMTSGTYTEVPDRSAFTKYLLERLNENEDTYLSSWELFTSFRNAVINNSEALPQFGEIQYVGDEGGDFIFLRKK
jgi:hypothetical protein